jgi:hypothetical protein
MVGVTGGGVAEDAELGGGQDAGEMGIGPAEDRQGRPDQGDGGGDMQDRADGDAGPVKRLPNPSAGTRGALKAISRASNNRVQCKEPP